jgi:hypothetical protein
MKDQDDGGMKLTQEFWKQAISSQISMLDAMAKLLDSVPKDMYGSYMREMYKANAAFVTLYSRAIEQTGGQFVHLQSEALRRSSDALKTVLFKMGGDSTPYEPGAKPKPS